MEAVDITLKVYLPFVIVFGTVINVCSMVHLRKTVLKSSVSLLLFALHVTDMIGIYSEPLSLLVNALGNHPLTRSTIMCEIIHCIYIFCVTGASWIVLFVVFQFAAKVCFSRSFTLKCITVVRLLAFTFAIAAFSSIFNVSKMNTFSRERQMLFARFGLMPKHFNTSERSRDDRYKFNFQLGILSTLLSVFIPLTLILATMVAHILGFKALSAVKNSQIAEIRASKSFLRGQKDYLTLSLWLGCSVIVSIVPIAFYSTQFLTEVSETDTILVYTLLSIPVHINTGIRPVYLLALKKNWNSLRAFFRTHVTSKFLLQDGTKVNIIGHDEPLILPKDHDNLEALNLEQRMNNKLLRTTSNVSEITMVLDA